MTTHLLPYNDGDVTVTSGSTALVGILTAFLTAVKPGDVLYAQGHSVAIASIADNTNAVLVRSWPGTTDTLDGATWEYEIRRGVGWDDAADLNLKVAELIRLRPGGASVTSLAIGTGDKTFAVQSGLPWQPGAPIRASVNGDATKWMSGIVTSYSGTSAVIAMDATSGHTSTHATWLLNYSGAVGPAGGISDHGALTGLSDDDHPQYLNNARGDARYSLAGHNHYGVYDPAGSAATAAATASAALAAHVAAGDPHPVYLTPAEANAGAAALAALAGREGLWSGFVAQSIAVLDYAGAKSTLGRPESLLTISRASAATFVGKNRLLQTASANTLRYHHDPATGERLGVWIEPAATNLLLRSEDLANASWTKYQTAATNGSANGPTGAATLSKFAATATSGVHTVSQSSVFATTNTNSYVASAFVRAAESDRHGIALYENPSFVRYGNATFNLTAKTAAFSAGGGASGAAGIEDWGGGLFRIWVSATLGGTNTSIQVRHIAIDATGVGTFTGDGTSGVHLGCCQFEVGTYPSSYIQTTTAAVARSADVVSLNTSVVPFDAEQGTLFIEFSIPDVATTNRRALTLSDGGFTEEMTLYVIASNSNQFYIGDGGVSVAALTAAGVAGGVVRKVAGAYRLNDIAFSSAGAAAITDTAATIPTVNKINIGSSGAGSGHLNGFVRCVGYFSRRLTNAEIQALTT